MDPYQVCCPTRDPLVSHSLQPPFLILFPMLKRDRMKERGQHLDPCLSTEHVAGQPDGSSMEV